MSNRKSTNDSQESDHSSSSEEEESSNEQNESIAMNNGALQNFVPGIINPIGNLLQFQAIPNYYNPYFYTFTNNNAYFQPIPYNPCSILQIPYYYNPYLQYPQLYSQPILTDPMMYLNYPYNFSNINTGFMMQPQQIQSPILMKSTFRKHHKKSQKKKKATKSKSPKKQTTTSDTTTSSNSISASKNGHEVIKNLQLSFGDENLFKGIIHYLTQKCGGNVSQKGVVNITSSSTYSCPISSDSYEPFKAADLDNTGSCFESNDSQNSWLCYDFKEARVKPNAYSIRSYTNGNGHMKSWAFEGSNDNSQWNILDQQTDSSVFKGPKRQGSFAIQNNNFYRYLRIRQTGKNMDGLNYLNISAFEIFGTLLE